MNRSEYLQMRAEFKQKSVGELLKLLKSEKLQTRFFAEMALRDLSGT